MNNRRIIIAILPWALLILVTFLWYRFSREKEPDVDKGIVNHNMIIEKIEAMGKLELVRYYIKDIVENTQELDWWPDQRVILMISGEVVGCLDLARIDSSKIDI